MKSDVRGGAFMDARESGGYGAVACASKGHERWRRCRGYTRRRACEGVGVGFGRQQRKGALQKAVGGGTCACMPAAEASGWRGPAP